MGIFKAYDIRGIYGKDVDEGIFYRIARAYAQFLRPSKVAVARDCRKSSPSLFQAFAKGLVDEGVDVIDLGLASTPISYFANGTLGVDGSVMITASHNTREWNGCKLCRANAVPISGATGIKDLEKIFEGVNEFDPPAGVGEITKVDVSKAYAEHVRSFTRLVRPLHLALDFANGMGIAESCALEGSGLTWDSLYGEYDGDFPNHDANPLHRETLKDLQELIRANPGKYAFGVAYDDGFRNRAHLQESARFKSRCCVLLRPEVVEGLRGDDSRSRRQADDVARRTLLHQGADARERRRFRGRTFRPLLFQGEFHRRIFGDGDIGARFDSRRVRQASLRACRSHGQVFAVGRD